MEELYLCYDCFWPICFPYGQKMHIGTGWYCWEKYHKDESSHNVIKFEFNTPKDDLIKYLKDAIDIYNSIKDSKDKNRIIIYLKKQIQYNRGDVIQKFLFFLCKNKDRKLDSELCEFFKSKNWKNFIDRQLAKKLRAKNIKKHP